MLDQLTTLYDKIIELLDEVKIVDADWSFIKFSNTVFHNILIDKLMNHGLGKWP